MKKLAFVVCSALLFGSGNALAAKSKKQSEIDKKNRWQVTCYLPNGNIIAETRAAQLTRNEKGEMVASLFTKSGKAELVLAIYGEAVCVAK